MQTLTKVVISDEHKIAASRFCDLLLSGTIQKAILPNHALDFSTDQREYDRDKYIRYISSSSYDEVIKILGLPYAGE